MAVSLLTALLEAHEWDKDPKSYVEEFNAWRGNSGERKELMLNALYAVLMEYTMMETEYAAAGAVGGILARAVTDDETPVDPGSAVGLRAQLRPHVIDRLHDLETKFP